MTRNNFAKKTAIATGVINLILFLLGIFILNKILAWEGFMFLICIVYFSVIKYPGWFKTHLIITGRPGSIRDTIIPIALIISTILSIISII